MSRRGSAPGRRPVERGAREAPACAALGRLCRRGRRPPGSLARGQLGEPVGAKGGGARGSGAEGGGGASGPARVRGHSAGCMAVVRLGSKGAAGTESASSVVVVVTTAVSTRWETLLCACVWGCWPAVAGTWARMGGSSAFPLPGPLESGVCQRLVPSARCAPAPRTPRVARRPGPRRTLAARARGHPPGRRKLPPGARRRGEGRGASPGRARPRPRLPDGSPGPAPHLPGAGGGPGGVALAGPLEPGRARARAGGASFQGFLALPRSRPPPSRL